MDSVGMPGMPKGMPSMQLIERRVFRLHAAA